MRAPQAGQAGFREAQWRRSFRTTRSARTAPRQEWRVENGQSTNGQARTATQERSLAVAAKAEWSNGHSKGGSQVKNGSTALLAKAGGGDALQAIDERPCWKRRN